MGRSAAKGAREMRGTMVRAAVAVALLIGLIPTFTVGAQAAPPDIVDQLKKIPGVTVVAESPVAKPYRFFLLTFRQPADHRDPSKGTFEQRVSLLHRDAAAPMVMHTSGYNLYEQFDKNGKLTRKPYLSEPAELLKSNQISVEYRFFTPSRPKPADWKNLNVWQAATDQHQIVSKLKAIYGKKWLSTGASKGGMTAVYHRRFYPNDVNAAIPYVAPNDVVNASDSYTKFLDNVGTDAQCRKDLQGAQRLALGKRKEIVAKVVAAAKESGETFDKIVGSADKGAEMSILDMPFALWQYGDQSMCASIPKQGASVDEIYKFFDDVVGMLGYSDQGLEGFTPYYYQAGTQLGWPTTTEKHVRDLLHYPNQNQPRSYVPKSIPMKFQPDAMLDIDLWVRLNGSRFLFIYGEYDPWGAEPFRTGPGTKDSHIYTAPKANHGAEIADLPEKERAAATAAVLRWGGVNATTLRSVPMSVDSFNTTPLGGTRPPM